MNIPFALKIAFLLLIFFAVYGLTRTLRRSTAEAVRRQFNNFRHRKIILIMILVTTLPALLAVFLYLNPNQRPTQTTNLGHLIQPVQQAESLQSFQGRWILAYFSNQCCSQVSPVLTGSPDVPGQVRIKNCQQHLFELQQLQKTLGRDRPRVQPLFLTLKTCPSNQLTQNLNKNLKNVTVKHADFLHSNRIYIIDPLGNIIMYYNEKNTPADIYRDLKQLLKVSQIG